MIPDDRLIDVVRQDVSVNYRPDSADWRDSAMEQQRKMELKVQETFSLMKRSSKVNKLISDSLQSISHEYEVSSAQKGAWGQDRARKRLRSDCYKMEH